MTSDESQVITVLGPVSSEGLGIVDAHSHLFIGKVDGGPPDAPVLTDEDGVGRELTAFRAAGGGAIVDCQPGGCGRDGRVLRRLSERTGVHVIASTGFHRRVYYPPGAPLFAMSVGAAADCFLDEIRSGLVETRASERNADETSALQSEVVYPGVIKIAAEASLEASPRALLEAAAAVCRETGYAIEMHTERGAAVEDFLAFFDEQGVPPGRLIFCHVDKRPDVGLHRELAQAGVMLEYDTFFRPKYDPESGVWVLIREMTAAGLAGQLALATDMADPGLWAELGGAPGLPKSFVILRERLACLDMLEETIAGLLGGNITGRLGVRE